MKPITILYIVLLTLALSGCIVYPSEISKCSAVCKNNGGWTSLNLDLGDNICSCKNGARFIVKWVTQ